MGGVGRRFVPIPSPTQPPLVKLSVGDTRTSNREGIMSRYRWAASWCAAALVAAWGLAAEPAADAPARLARRLWAVTDVILARHIDPPARQEMLLAALKGVHAKTKVATPAGLGRLVSEVTSEEQFA